ncbi:MAG TPA: hypothetical protein VNA15_00135 [Candidatus Angelobacter sp.]|nr:hypothetical protein [Candidatus Angelobacter sp.]
MAKFIMSIGDTAYDVLANEAKNRDVTVQQLLRAVVVPEWIRQNEEGRAPMHNGSDLIPPSIYTTTSHDSRMLVSPAARLRR